MTLRLFLSTVILTFILQINTIYAQSGFHRLPTRKTAISIGYQQYNPAKRDQNQFRFEARTIWGKFLS